MSDQELFGRRCTVLCGPNKQDGKLIENLRISFKVEKNLEKHPNPANIQIYNLSESSRGIIEQKNSQVLLSAGYQNDLKVLFKGTVAKVTTKQVGPDIITEIEAGDGDFAFGNSQINLSFSPGAMMGDVIQSVKASLGLADGQQKGVDTTQSFPHGLSLSGMAKDALTTVLNKQGLEWSIQDETLQILPQDAATDEQAIALYSGWSEEHPYNTGLVGSPFKMKILDPLLAKPVDGKIAENGIKLTALLNPEIRPGRTVDVDSKFVQGVFRVYKVTFTGDTHGPQWYAEMEAR